MKRIGLFLLAVVLMLGVAGCSSDDSNDNPLVGTWTGQDGADTIVLTFKEDNTYTSTSNGNALGSGNWSVSGNQLTLSGPNSSNQTITYSINGDTLTFTLSNGTTGVYTRV